MEEKKNKNKEEVAIKVENLSKTFRIPHEKRTSLKSTAFNLFEKKTFTEFCALEDINFEVKRGEFFGIIGRNGSGKSTLLKILAGIYLPDRKGQVTVSGKLSPFLELGVGFNFDLTGRENIFLGGAILGLPRKEVAEKFDKIVRFAELEEFIDMKMKNFSSGMQVRLAFSLAIHAHAEILLMDEVLAVGDTNFQSKCLDEFNQYREQGKTVILVTHDVSVVERYCDRAMLLRDGKIETISEAPKVVNKYQEMNMQDEEKRIKNDQEEDIHLDSLVNIQSHQGVSIKKIIFTDINGNLRNAFETRDSVSVKVIYEIKKELNNPVFGIIIKDVRGSSVFVTNTLFKKIKTGIYGSQGRELVEVSFDINNFFAEGLYKVSPGVANSSARIFYDWQEDFAKFKIINKEYSSGGIVDFDHKIVIKRKPS